MKEVPLSSVLPYYLLAPLFLLVAQVMLVFSGHHLAEHYFHPVLLAFTHLLVLGWATMLIFGATNQIVPVIAEQDLKSRRVPLLVILLLGTGAILLSFGFYDFRLDNGTLTGGSLVLLSFIAQGAHILVSAREKNNIHLECIKSAHIWLIITGSIGLGLLFNFRFPWLKGDHMHYLRIHASLGMTGWFLLLVVGAAGKLVPMFLVSSYTGLHLIRRTNWLINAGLILVLLNGLFGWSRQLDRLAYILVLSGLIHFLLYVMRCYKSRLRKKNEPAMKQTALALGFSLVPAAAILCYYAGSGIPETRIIAATGVSFFCGFITLLIMGQTFKTLPFIIWMHSKAKELGSGVLPRDFYSDKLVSLQMYAYAGGFVTFLSGLLAGQGFVLRLGAVLMLSGVLVYVGQVLFVVFKIRK